MGAGLVVTPVAVLHFAGFATDGQGQQLVTETDSHDWFTGFEPIFDGFYGIGTFGGITGTVADEQGIKVRDIHRGIVGQHGHLINI